MIVIHPGHKYQLDILDGIGYEEITFLKRNDPPEKYPGNDNAYPGTNLQEVCRALINRVQYLESQKKSYIKSTHYWTFKVCHILFRV